MATHHKEHCCFPWRATTACTYTRTCSIGRREGRGTLGVLYFLALAAFLAPLAAALAAFLQTAEKTRLNIGGMESVGLFAGERRGMEVGEGEGGENKHGVLAAGLGGEGKKPIGHQSQCYTFARN